jgi:hypothetical protein
VLVPFEPWLFHLFLVKLCNKQDVYVLGRRGQMIFILYLIKPTSLSIAWQVGSVPRQIHSDFGVIAFLANSTRAIGQGGVRMEW